MDHAEFGENTRQYVAEFVRFADAKAGALLTFSSVVAASLGALCSPALGHFGTPHPVWTFVAVVASLPFIVATVMTALRCVEALAPRTPAAADSLTSFPDIASVSPEEYVSRVRALPVEGISDEYAKLNSQLSRVSVAKYTALSQAAWWLRVQILSAYVAGMSCAAVIGLGS
jgi:hypothetical protein